MSVEAFKAKGGDGIVCLPFTVVKFEIVGIE